MNNVADIDSVMRRRFFGFAKKSRKCWHWTGAKNQQSVSGHGQFRIPGTNKRVQAHRLSYELAGNAIPDGAHLHHTCENPLCVNPEHLLPMQPSEHMLHHLKKPDLEGAVQCVSAQLPLQIVAAIDAERYAEGLTRSAVIRRHLMRIYQSVPKRKSA